MPANNTPLSGRAALITGVSRSTGIGYATARRLGHLGANLFLHAWTPHDRSQSWAKGLDIEGVESLAERLRSEGMSVGCIEADFFDSKAPSQAMSAAVDAYRHIDILIANHAYSSWQSLANLTVDDLDRHLAVNVRATLMLAQALGAQHDGRPGGRMIMMTSGQASAPMEREIAYAASKGALHQITQTLSASLISKGITVNTINPGPTDTGWAGESEKRFVAQHMPLGRWGEPDDAARLIAWLCTDDAQWITGQVIESSGGFKSGFRQADIPEG